MAQDFAKRRRAPAKKGGYQSQVPGWVWLFTGSVLGAFVMFLVYLAGIPPQAGQLSGKLEETVSKVTQPNAQPSSEDSELESADGIPKPRFDFYRLLKDSEVVVETAPARPITTPRPSESTSESNEVVEANVEYVLQVGSFKNLADADRLRAELILLNLDAGIETVQLRNSETWHRVIVGPYRSKPAVSKARSTLYANNLENILFKRATGG